MFALLSRIIPLYTWECRTVCTSSCFRVAFCQMPQPACMYATVGPVQVRSIRRSVSNCRHAISNDYEDVNLVQNDDDAHEGGSDDDDAVENAVGDSC